MRDYNPKEFKVISLQDCPVPANILVCDTPDKAAEYWRLHLANHPYLNMDCECLVTIILNIRHQVKGHHVVSIGLMDQLLVHPREVFHVALVMKAHSIIVAHNHPSGDPTPSAADVRVTQELVKAGQILRVDVVDHIVIGGNRHCSLREMGYIHT